MGYFTGQVKLCEKLSGYPQAGVSATRRTDVVETETPQENSANYFLISPAHQGQKGRVVLSINASKEVNGA